MRASLAVTGLGVDTYDHVGGSDLAAFQGSSCRGANPLGSGC